MLSQAQLASKLERAVAQAQREEVRWWEAPAAALPSRRRCRRPTTRACPSASPVARQAVAAAKKHAVAQRVDVETFQALVSAARLAPVQGGLRLDGTRLGKPALPRQFLPDGSLPGAAAPAAPGTRGGALPPGAPSSDEPGLSSQALDAALRSGAHFKRAWRAASPASRVALLQHAKRAGALPRLLKLELSSRMLEEAVSCLAGHLEAAGAAPTRAGTAAGTVTAGQHAGGAAATPGSIDNGNTSAGTAEWEQAAALAAAVLHAAEGASSWAVAKAGLSLQGRQGLASLGDLLAARGRTL